MRLRNLTSTFFARVGVVAVIVAFAGSVWAAPRYKVLHAFTGGRDGGGLWSSLVRDKKGNLLAPASNGKWKYTVLHTFIGSDGAQPDANLILDSKGNLYGTTATGGAGGAGVAFEITP